MNYEPARTIAFFPRSSKPSTGRETEHGHRRSFHKVSKKYMPHYVAELQFRDDNRNNANIFGAAI
jgi:hypothetical protein